MHRTSVGVVGASGYAGIEATRLLAAHPQLRVRFLTSDRWLSETVGKRLGLGGEVGALRYTSVEDAAPLFKECAAVLLATPTEVSLELGPQALAAGARVIDLSGAFRLQDAAIFERFYGLAHPQQELLREAVYGLPELFRDQVRSARLVANPGCYPTAAALALSPLVHGGLIDPSRIVINAASGVTGAGRKASEDFSFTEIDGDFRAYKVFRHQHTPEISQTLSGPGGPGVWVTFTPHLLPVKRGILSTAYAWLRPGASATEVGQAFARAYQAEPFVTLADTPEEVSLKGVVGTNRCQLGFACDPDHPERLIVVSAIDNLLKGAAGQAVQNLNLMMGWPEASGLTS